jgi:hypothetical protein
MMYLNVWNSPKAKPTAEVVMEDWDKEEKELLAKLAEAQQCW